MPFFRYWGIGHNNTMISHEGIFSSLEELHLHLKLNKIRLLNFKKKRFFYLKKIKKDSLGNLCKDISYLLKTGFPLYQVLYFLFENQQKRYIKYRLEQSLRYIKNGNDIDSLACLCFSPFALVSLKNSMVTGNSADVFNELGQAYLEESENQKEWLKILFYPVVLSIMVIALFCVSSEFLLPVFKPILAQEHQGFAYKSFLWASAYSSHILFLVSFIFLSGFYFFYKHLKMRLHIHQFWKRFAFCLNHQVSVIEALKLSSQELNKKLQYDLEEVVLSIKIGSSLTYAFSKSSLNNELLNHFLKLTETSGNCSKLISSYEKLLEKNYKDFLKQIMSWTPSIYITIIGIMIFWIAMATIVPVYETFSNLNE